MQTQFKYKNQKTNVNHLNHHSIVAIKINSLSNNIYGELQWSMLCQVLEKRDTYGRVTALYKLAYQWGIKGQGQIYTAFFKNALLKPQFCDKRLHQINDFTITPLFRWRNKSWESLYNLFKASQLIEEPHFITISLQNPPQYSGSPRRSTSTKWDVTSVLSTHWGEGLLKFWVEMNVEILV